MKHCAWQQSSDPKPSERLAGTLQALQRMQVTTAVRKVDL